MTLPNQFAAVRAEFNAIMAEEFDATVDFTLDSPTVIESSPYVNVGDPVAFLRDSDEDFAALIVSYHEPRDR